MKTAVIPGSFDPPTIGHLDIFERTAAAFDRVIVAVLCNPEKAPAFTVEERVELVKLTTAHLHTVEVTAFSGLLSEFIRKTGAAAVVKGIRNSQDYEYELMMAAYNRALWGSAADTFFLPCRPEFAHVSSSGVKQLAQFGGDFLHYLPEAVAQRVAQRLKRQGGF